MPAPQEAIVGSPPPSEPHAPFRDVVIHNPYILATLGIAGLAVTTLDIFRLQDQKRDQEYSQFGQPASAEVLQEAQTEVTIFQDNVKEVIRQGELIIEVPRLTSDPQHLRESMLIQRREQERETFRRLYKDRSAVDIILFLASAIPLLAGGLEFGIRKMRAEEARRQQRTANST